MFDKFKKLDSTKGGISTRSGKGENSCRQVSTVPRQLVKSHPRQLGTGYSNGIQDRIPGKPFPTHTPKSGCAATRRATPPTTGDTEVALQGRDNRSCREGSRAGLPLEPVPSSQEGRWHEASNKPKEPERVRRPSRFQDGGAAHLKGHSEKERLADEGGPEGRLLHGADARLLQASPPLFGPEPSLPVHMSAIRPMLCSMGLYQDPKASPNLAQRAWSKASGLHRRHPCPSGDGGDGEGPHRRANIPTREPGVHSSPREVYHNPDPGDRVPWYGCRLTLNGATAPGAESKETEARIFKDQGSDSPAHCSGGVMPTGEIQLGFPGNTSGSSVLQEPTEGPSKCLGNKRTKLRCSLPAVTGSQGGAGLVDEPFHLLEWEEPGTQTTRAPDRIRRLTGRVGSILPGHPDGRSLVPSRKEDAHQLPRAPGSDPGSKDLSKGPGRQKGAAVTGQSDSSSLHKQPGWDSVPPGNQVSQGLMDVVSGERHPPYSTTPTGGREYQGGQGVESDERSLRLDAEPRDFSSDMDSFSPTGSRPICHSSILPAP